MNEIRTLTAFATACVLGAAAAPARAQTAEAPPPGALPASTATADDTLLPQRREQLRKAAAPIADETVPWGRNDREQARKKQARTHAEDPHVAAEQQRLVAAALLRLARNA